jgi:hypothetical protein
MSQPETWPGAGSVGRQPAASIHDKVGSLIHMQRGQTNQNTTQATLSGCQWQVVRRRKTQDKALLLVW